MEHSNIWLIDHKATLSENSPMNMDGSSWILGVCVLKAPDREAAMEKFSEFLKSEGMELLESYEVSEYSATNFADESKRSRQINNAARMVGKDGETCYVYARTSEAMACDEGDA